MLSFSNNSKNVYDENWKIDRVLCSSGDGMKDVYAWHV